MFDAAPHLTHLIEDLDTPKSLEIREKLYRMQNDYQFRNEIRKEMLQAVRSIFKSNR